MEGFKGFTTPQKILVQGKHIFLFGPNGCGKSSIIEAIRWCMFGATGRPEEIVRNQFYAENCYVELELKSAEGLWRVQRRLSPGSSRSRMTILDPEGKERIQSDIFPFLTSLGPREGTYIIFGGPSQFPSRRRPLESIEISDFDKIIYAYLRLEEIPDLIERINGLIERQKETERLLAEEIEEEERKIASELEEINRQLSLLLRDPPWGEEEPPTLVKTRDKLKTLINQLAELNKQEPSINLLDDDLIFLADDWIRNFFIPKEDDLNNKLSEIKDKQISIRTLYHELETKKNEIEIIENQIEDIEKSCLQLLGDNKYDLLLKELEEITEKITQKGLELDITKKVNTYLDNFELTRCFICLSEINKKEIKPLVEQILEQSEPELLNDINKRNWNENLLENIKKLDEQVETLKPVLQQYLNESEEIEKSIFKILGYETITLTLEKIESYLSKLEEQRINIEKLLISEKDFKRRLEKRLENIKEEFRFHMYRNKKEKLETILEVRVEPIKEQYADLVDYRESLEEIKKALVFQLKSVLQRVLPDISKMMTKVYQHITQQVSFDQIQIMLEEQDNDLSAKLLVRVSSSKKPDLPPMDPERVLNGQALNALRLVPYFVFSTFEKEMWGLDLLLLDDPTQSFDVIRVELLLDELRNAANHAQLVIATPEKDRFDPFFSKYFLKEEITIIHVSGFEIEKGPKLELE